MTAMKCNTCNGLYDTQTKDGLTYFHACAPVWDSGQKTWVEPPNKRDENIISTAPAVTPLIKSPGTGATKV